MKKQNNGALWANTRFAPTVYKAFTLVELIVVITILAILGTIAFISLQGYSRDARDSVRISDIKNIETGLELFLTKAGTLPIPDNKVDITSSGSIISYQGFAGKNILNILKIFNGGKDQVTGKYYTYTIDSIKKHYQILGFLENGNIANSIIMPNVYASNNNIITRGSEIGVLLDQSNTPVQELSSIISSGSLDILNTKNIYISYFNNTDSITGTGNALRGMIGGGGLVGYWNFDQMNGTGFIDYSPNNTVSSFSGGVTLTGGQVGSAAYFDGINGEFNVDTILGLGESQGSPHTISAWIKVDNIVSDIAPINRQWILILGEPGRGSHHWLEGGYGLTGQFGIWGGPQVVPNISSGYWYYITVVYDGLNIKSYLNGKLEKNNGLFSSRIVNMNLKNAKLNVGKKQLSNESYFKGVMDELRIYNRALSSFEVKQLYNIR